MTTKMNRAQCVALKKIYMRTKLTDENGDKLSYLSFRRYVVPGYDCVMVPWSGMWLGIEPDGYTHS